MLTSSESEADSDDDNDRPRKRARHANNSIAIPGEVITSETQWMRGHGTFIPGGSEESNAIHASLAGPVEKTNRLLTVVPMRARKSLFSSFPYTVLVI
jgi:exosome complex component RRP4